MLRRSIPALLALWALVVVAVSALTWVVVNGVGRDVGLVTNASVYAAGAPSAGIRHPANPTPSGGATPAGTATAGAADGSSTSTEGSSASTETVGGAGSAIASTGPTDEGVPAPPAQPHPPAPAPTDQPTQPAGPGEPPATTRTFSTAGGSVTASCRAQALSLDGIAPLNGYHVEHEFESGHLSVKFTSPSAEIGVEITCRAGVPTLDS